MKPTKKDWAKWANHKSNKDKWIEEQEREEEEKEQEDENENYLAK